MLVLSRKKDNVVRIGSAVKIKVLSVHKNCVKLGIEAPRDIEILRDELVRERCERTCGQ